ncbi:MAG: alpha-mannosidase [Geminocystis sp.]|nr:alpha-mannosidase [Geminocystis sp.]HIK36993.1 alpha-mannosidase [Geminocystis sp. M7585_C2015_104]
MAEYITNRLRRLTEVELQNNWFFSDIDYQCIPTEIDKEWQKAKVNDKGYLIWEKGRKIRWFAQKIIIPHSLSEGYPVIGLDLRLALTWWAESARVFVNGKLRVEGDLFDSSCRFLVAENVQENQEFFIALRLVSPSHDNGGLMLSRCIYEAKKGKIDPSFVANELTILYKYLQSFYPDKEAEFEEAIGNINWGCVDNQGLFNQELENLRKRLLPLSKYIKERNFCLLGHAHLDLAWLWDIEETYEVAEKTFNSVLNLQKEYKYLVFGHTTIYLYSWLSQKQPHLFRQIQQAVTEKKWEVLGGMWVEAEVNLIGGESLVRQLLYGQKYAFLLFGKYCKVAWLIDSFGFPWQLPQFLQQAEIKYFVTGKLHWNDTNFFPYGCFWWESPDGSRIFTLISPPNVAGVMDTNPLTMTDYGIQWEKQTGLKDIFWLPGVGDHGGGPTRDMLEMAQRYQQSPFFPNLQFVTAETFLDKISNSPSTDYPIWKDELYLEFHRGCYTTHGDQKYFNRYSETLLYQAELFATIATILKQKHFLKQHHFSANSTEGDYSPNIIESLWQKVLVNQFHDILPGTSIAPVFTTANRLWQEVITTAKTIITQSLKSISAYLPPPPLDCLQEIVVFNSLNWQRGGVVELDLNKDIEKDKTKQILKHQCQVYDAEGKPVLTEVTPEGKLLFYADNIPSIGYKTFYLLVEDDLVDNLKLPANILPHNPMEFILENQYLRVTINPSTGNLSQIFDKVNQKEVLAAEGNQLQLFEDKGQYWDAWNINPEYRKFPLPSPRIEEIEWLEKGKLRQIIRVKKTYNRSSFTQDYILEYNSPLLEIRNEVDWQEDYTLVKTKFPLTVKNDFVTYEIACGSIQRRVIDKAVTPFDKAKWEVYGHRWADLSDNLADYGVSLLNDCKYGYSATSSELHLTLLRSPRWPDATADRMTHQFRYAIYPHRGSWQEAKTVRKGYEFNQPFCCFLPTNNNTNNKRQPSPLAYQGEFISLGDNSLILMAFKQAENSPDKYILRLYESEGKKCQLKIQNNLGLAFSHGVNLLENHTFNEMPQVIQPHKIVSFLFKTNSPG